MNEFEDIFRELFSSEKEKNEEEVQKKIEKFDNILPSVLMLSNDSEQREKDIEKYFGMCHTLAIGDLNGSYESLCAHLNILGMNEREPDGKKVIFVGDILADRIPEGLKCLDTIGALQQRGHKIEILVGNHDAWFLRYILLGDTSVIFQCLPKYDYWQGRGLLELLEYIPSLRGVDHGPLEHFAPELLMEFHGEIYGALTTLNPLWFQVMKNMKFFYVDKITQTLYIHTPPTPTICAYVADGLRRGRESMSVQEAFDAHGIEGYAHIFSSTNNRIRREEIGDNEYTFLQGGHLDLLGRVGIKRIVCGHDTIYDEIDMSHVLPKNSTHMKLYNVDGGSFRSPKEEFFSSCRSILGISIDQKVIGMKKRGVLQSIEGVMQLEE